MNSSFYGILYSIEKCCVHNLALFHGQMMSALKTGNVIDSKMVSIVQRKREREQKIPVDRSGGGL